MFCVLLNTFFPDWSWSNFAVEIIGASIGGVITVIVFYSEIKKDRKEERDRKKADRAENLKYFSSIIRNTVLDLDKQVKEASELSSKIKANPLEIPLLKQSGVKDLYRIVYTLDQEKFYHAYLDKFGWQPKAVEDFRRMYTMLDYFHSSIHNELQSLEKKIEYNHKRNLKFLELITLSIDSIDFISMHGTFNDPDFKNELIGFMDVFRKTKFSKSDISVYKLHFIEPLSTVILPKVNTYAEVMSLMLLLREANNLYSQIEAQNLEVAKDFKTWEKQTIEALTIFKGLTYQLRRNM